MPVLSILFAFFIQSGNPTVVLGPFDLPDRASATRLKLTDIGEFGLWRVSRPTVPGHFHTGIDLARPAADSAQVKIYPLAEGTVISIRRKGPYSQVVVEHSTSAKKTWWSVYEHFIPGDIRIHQKVKSTTSIGRMMIEEELNRMGWQFNHLHLEILKAPPQPLKPTDLEPDRQFMPFTLQCYSPEELKSRYVNPLAIIGQPVTAITGTVTGNF